MVDLAEILRRHWPAYLLKFLSRVPLSHRRAVAAIRRCRTPQLGGQLYRCTHCGKEHCAYHSCNHRACPKCGHHDATAWIAKQKTLLLPVPYFLVTFTVPAELRAAIRSRQKLCYNLLFAESSAALQDIAADPKHFGVQLGFLGVLQTWTRDLRYHPHIHYLVPGGGLSHDQLRWLQVPNSQFLLCEPVLALRFRTRLKRALQQKDPHLFVRIPTKAWSQPWVVDVLPVGRGEPVLKYLSAYIYKTAITSQRLVACDDTTVSFLYRDSASRQWKFCHLSAERFLHRFLQHILPSGFQRVRYFGWLAPAASKRRERIFALLDWKAPQFLPPPLLPPPVPAMQDAHDQDRHRPASTAMSSLQPHPHRPQLRRTRKSPQWHRNPFVPGSFSSLQFQPAAQFPLLLLDLSGPSTPFSAIPARINLLRTQVLPRN